MSKPLTVQEFFNEIRDWPTVVFQAHELVRSNEARLNGFDNLPTREQLQNLREFVKLVLLPLRTMWDAQLIINSGFRSAETNAKVGGDGNSYHMANHGAAADVRTSSASREGTLMLWNELIHSKHIPFNEAVLYKTPNRIHIGWDKDPAKNIRELWVANPSGGYEKFQPGVHDLV